MLIVEQDIRRILSKACTLTKEVDKILIEDDLSLLGMDSLSFVRVVVEIEKNFDIEFPDEFLLLTKMGTIDSMCKNIIILINH